MYRYIVIYILDNLCFLEQHTASTYMIEGIKMAFDERSAINRSLASKSMFCCLFGRNR